MDTISLQIYLTFFHMLVLHGLVQHFSSSKSHQTSRIPAFELNQTRHQELLPSMNIHLLSFRAWVKFKLSLHQLVSVLHILFLLLLLLCSYNGAVIKGSQASSDIINGETKLGSFSFDGQILTINAGALSGYSKVLGFTNSSKATSYYRIQFTSSVTETNILPGAIVNYTTATIAVVGMQSVKFFQLLEVPSFSTAG